VYFEVLSPYTYAMPPDIPDGIDLGKYTHAVNVGWLADDYVFEEDLSPRRLFG